MKIEIDVKRKEVVKEEVDGKQVKKIVKIDDVFVADLDMSLNAQTRFEIKFPELAAKGNLIDQTNILKNIDPNNIKTTDIVLMGDVLKMVYCWFDTDVKYVDFVKMFDFTDVEYTKYLTKEFIDLFKLVMDSSAEKN